MGRVTVHSVAEWQHLQSLVDALAVAGNAPVGDGFTPTQGGYSCSMSRDLDFDLLRPLVAEQDFPVEMVEADDLVWCRHCWASISGARHDAAARQAWLRARTT